MEQMAYNLLFRWFVGLAMDAPIWDVTVFTKEPGTIVGGRCRRQVPAEGAEPAAGQGAAVR